MKLLKLSNLKKNDRPKMNRILLLIITLATISAKAQTPPVPLAPTVKSNILTRVEAKKPKTFTTTCPHCGMKFSNLHPVNVITNGSKAAVGGSLIERTLTFACPNRGCLETFDSKNVTFMQESIAVEDEPVPMPVGGGGASTVLPDTNAPVVTNIVLRAASILDFTNQVPVAYSINTGHYYWLDALTGQQVTKAFDLTFQAHSNYFYTVWLCSPLSGHGSNWFEYPTDHQLHPARSEFLAGVAVPIYETNRFVAVRAFNGGNRVTWQ